MEAISKPIPSHVTAVAAPIEERETMRAILQAGYGSAEVLRVAATERPKPRDGEVLVQVNAAGLDRGTWHLMTGRPYLMRIMGFGFLAPKNPVPGLDLAGTVVEVGPNVTRFRIGDTVFGIGQGSFAEYTRAREDKLAHKPPSLSFEQAAVLGVSGITALNALDAGRVQAGERVLIVGASGGVGTFAVQIAKALGAEVTGVCSTAKVETVRSIGADHVLDYTQSDFADGAKRFDLILDIGGNTPLPRLRRALTETGRLVFVGGENGGDWSAGFGRQLQAFALAPFVRQRFAMLMAREHFSELERLAALVEAGKLSPVIDRRCPLASVPDALRDLEAGRVCGKVVVSIA
jgi:2-desacetyl-2-hydroxyethyl bacteriochlorophyllide A dehydrogenase